MPFVYIWELSDFVTRGGAVVPKAPGILQQTPISLVVGQSVQSAKFAAGTAFIMVSTDEIVGIAIGTNPTATTSSFRLPQGVFPLLMGVNPGDQLAAIPSV